MLNVENPITRGNDLTGCNDSPVITCDCCSQPVTPATVIQDNYLALCSTCYDREYKTCEACEYITHEENMTTEHFCSDCVVNE